MLRLHVVLQLADLLVKFVKACLLVDRQSADILLQSFNAIFVFSVLPVPSFHLFEDVTEFILQVAVHVVVLGQMSVGLELERVVQLHEVLLRFH